jgi:hypothetical protein
MNDICDISDYFSSDDQRVNERVVTIIHDISGDVWMNLPEMCGKFYEIFDTSLLIYPLDHTLNEVWFLCVDTKPIEQLKQMECFVSGWIASKNN